MEVVFSHHAHVLLFSLSSHSFSSSSSFSSLRFLFYSPFHSYPSSSKLQRFYHVFTTSSVSGSSVKTTDLRISSNATGQTRI